MPEIFCSSFSTSLWILRLFELHSSRASLAIPTLSFISSFSLSALTHRCWSCFVSSPLTEISLSTDQISNNRADGSLLASTVLFSLLCPEVAVAPAYPIPLQREQ